MSFRVKLSSFFVLTVLLISTIGISYLARDPVGSVSAANIEHGSILANQGRENIPACVSCHGKDGQGDVESGVPRLAGLHPKYIEKQLQDFARDPLNTRVALDPISRDYSKTPRVNVDLTVYTPGTRRHPMMNEIARNLLANEKQHLALYFSRLSYISKPIPEDFETLARGEDLVLRGKPEYGVPACISCHGNNVEGIGAIFPSLAGQPPKYIVEQINNWQIGKRDNDHMALMRNIANQLTDGDKANIAAYIANLSYTVNVD